MAEKIGREGRSEGHLPRALGQAIRKPVHIIVGFPAGGGTDVLARILADPASPGRPYVLHATDEVVTEFAIEQYAASAPLHVLGLRTPTAKYATYSRWPAGVIDPLYQGSESELYDYRTQAGRLELENSAGRSALEDSLRPQLERAVSEELRAPLPSRAIRPSAVPERGRSSLGARPFGTFYVVAA